jgi:glyoxylase-like metal-dependent hydrolase (beta-lactamase superfamily II)
MRDSRVMDGDLTTTVAPGVIAIDTVMAGEPELNAVYLLDGMEPCLIETGPGADHDRLTSALDALGIGGDDLVHIVVTHIHMDHAGGAGALLVRYPNATVWVHEAGARHLVDPERLIASTARTYGTERMRSLYGDMVPVPSDRVRPVGEGDRIDMGGRSLDVVHTPGHAAHHIALYDDVSGAMFTGEAIGSYLPWASCFRPALPPPEVDIEAALASIRRIAERRPTTLLTSHFGAVPDVADACALATDRIQAWAQEVRGVLEDDADAPEDVVVEALSRRARREFEADAGRAFEPARYDALGSIRMNAQGLARYWRTRWEREAG